MLHKKSGILHGYLIFLCRLGGFELPDQQHGQWQWRGERSEWCPSGAFAVRRKRGERVTRGKQRAEALAMPVAPTEIADCKPEKTGNSAKNRKPGSVGKSTLPGVEAGEESMTAGGGNLVRAEGSKRPENCPVDSFQWRTGGSPGGNLIRGETNY